jgi:aspartate/methionine/tyrosine aminotransferase
LPKAVEIGHFTWLRTHKAKYNVSSSGMTPIKLEEISKLGSSSDIINELVNIYGIDKRNVALTHGTQEGNFATLSALRELGIIDTAVTVIPEYEPIRVLPKFLGLRQMEVNIEGSLMDVLNFIKPGTVVLLSNPNNPTGMSLSKKLLWELSDSLRRVGSYAILDSIFLEFVEEDLRDLPIENMIYTFSTSKFYTMNELKVGWVIGDEKIIREINGVVDLVSPLVLDLDLGYVSILLRNRDWVRRRNLSIIMPNVETLRRIIGEIMRTAEVQYVEYMPILYLRPKCQELTGMKLANKLLERDVLVVPGQYFGRDDGVRIGLGSVDKETFETAMNIVIEVIRQECERHET